MIEFDKISIHNLIHTFSCYGGMGLILVVVIISTIKLHGSDSVDIFEPVVVRMAPANESTIIALEDGSYKIFYINRPGDADKLMSIQSVDGIHWSQPEKEIDLPGQAYYANQVIVDRDGVLHCVFHIWGEGNNGYRGRHLNLWHACRKPDENEWEKPKKIYDGYVGSIRNFMQLQSGRLLMSFGKAVPQRERIPHFDEVDFGWNEIMVLYSDDKGKNWKASGDLLKIEIDSDKNTRYGAIEPNIIELKNGKLWMLIRTNKGHLYESFSDDYGEQWTEPLPSIFISSDSPTEFLRLKDGRIVLVFNMNQRWDDPNSYAFGGREVLHAAISKDEGLTWSGFREILDLTDLPESKERGDRGTAYSSAVETEEGKIVLVTGQGKSRSIVLFDPNWLEEEKNIQVTEHSSKNILSNSDVVMHFPCFKAGEVSFQMHLPSQKQVFDFALTDHFSVAEDSLASEHGIFFHSLEIKKKHTGVNVKIIWDVENEYSRLFLNGKEISESGLRRNSQTGINYLRIGLEETDPYTKAVLKIDNVSILSNPNEK